MGSTLDDLSASPKNIKRAFGYALGQVQIGRTPPSAKPLKQFGAGVFELRDIDDGDAYRAVYAVKLIKAIYVLHVFKKKSKSGIGIPRPDVQIIEERLRRARLIDAATNGS
ncbi:MAG: type II toxin-antitoxin system RelE/ParE family toxin [Alphaproteobacteria bacterium]|nr:type II toxin-antitoxin system RelE/ParE family toxin [Alphaproteobacteria bacterium]